MTVVLCLAAIVSAAAGVWWAALVFLAMGCACAGDAVRRERQAIDAQRRRRLMREIHRYDKEIEG